MESNTLIFKNEMFGTIRTVEIDGKIYFVGIDVAGALGYKEPKDAVSRHCKGATFHRLPDNQGFIQETKVIPEGDVYRLIIRSKLPGAEKFESWIFDEVIPAIRKTGAYFARPLTVAEQLLGQAQVLVEHEKRLQSVENKVIAIENKVQSLTVKPDKDSDMEYFTVIGWCRLKGFHNISLKDAQTIGRMASIRSKELGYPIRYVEDARFRQVGSYARYVWEHLKGL